MTKERIDELEELITHHRTAYYNGRPEISDEAFDALEDELRSLDPSNPVLSDVGASPDSDGWRKRSHLHFLGSLRKARNPDEMRDWCDRFTVGSFAWSEKLDGISLGLQYRDGSLVAAVTRGNGEVGEEITPNAVLFRGVQRELGRDFSGTIRGEVVLPLDDWRNHLSGYSNPRNACSGIARIENRSDASRKCPHLSFYAYDLLADKPPHEDETEKYLVLEDMGFPTPNHGGGFGPEELIELRDRYQSDLRSELNYEIDGLVVRLSERRSFESAGSSSGRPKAAVAYKFPNEGATTILRDVSWEVGNTGRITPVAEFDTVNLVGAEVWRASLYNPDYVDGLELRIGDRVRVERANDVIPRVEEVVEHRGGDFVEPPGSCPACSSDVEREGAYLRCTSPACSAKSIGLLKRWVESLDLLGWGDSILKSLIEKGAVATPADLYELGVGELASVQDSGGSVLGETIAQRLLERLEQNKEPMAAQFIGGLNVPMLRERTAVKIAEVANGLDDVLDMSLEELLTIEGIGEKKATAILKGLEERKPTIDRLVAHGVKPEFDTGGSLDGLKFCLTGRMSQKRSEIESDIRAAGGEAGGATNDLDYLVTNDPTTTSSKAQKAREMDVPFISEDDLYEMMGE